MYIQMTVASQNYHLEKQLIYFFIDFREHSQTKLEMQLFFVFDPKTHYQLDCFQKSPLQDEYYYIGNNPLSVLKALKTIPREKPLHCNEQQHRYFFQPPKGECFQGDNAYLTTELGYTCSQLRHRTSEPYLIELLSWKGQSG